MQGDALTEVRIRAPASGVFAHADDRGPACVELGWGCIPLGSQPGRFVNLIFQIIPPR